MPISLKLLALIPCGAYWFSYAMSADEAKREAQVFLQTIKGKSFEYPVYMDLENEKQFALGKAACSAIVDAFLRACVHSKKVV